MADFACLSTPIKPKWDEGFFKLSYPKFPIQNIEWHTEKKDKRTQKGRKKERKKKNAWKPCKQQMREKRQVNGNTYKHRKKQIVMSLAGQNIFKILLYRGIGGAGHPRIQVIVVCIEISHGRSLQKKKKRSAADRTFFLLIYIFYITLRSVRKNGAFFF